jgi:CHAD domain-containing protein
MSKVHRLTWDEQGSAGQNARRELPALAAAYFAQARELLTAKPSPAKLHRLRIASKRLRYTLELFRGCYGPGFEIRITALRKVQQSLGEVNDSVAAWRVLSKTMARSAQRSRVEQHLKQEAAAKAQEFREHWSKLFDAPGRELWWTGYLARNSRR